jgi:Putative auto-transporter adhesin, head GIN domain
MRNSQKVLLSVLAIVMLSIVVLAVGARSVLTSFAEASSSGRVQAAPAREYTGISADLTGFDELLVREGWQVDIRQGDAWRVDVDVPSDAENVIVGVQDGRLVLDANRGPAQRWNWWFGSRDRYRAEIVMPALAGIVVEGAADVDIADFDGGTLALRLSGTSNVEGRNSRFDRVIVTSDGANNVDFARVAVSDAELNLSGFSNVMLEMSGGDLTGSLSGFGNVTYSGSVDEENVDVSGLGRVGPAR